VPASNVTEFPLGKSVAYAGISQLASSFGFARYNPDILLGRKGYGIYDQMAVDEQVQAVLKFKRDAILSRQWDFTFERDTTLSTDEQKDRVELMKQLVSQMKGSFTDSMAYIMRAMRHGFSVNEKIFDMVEIQNVAYYACVELRAKPPYSFYFKTDAYGNLVDFGQNSGGQLRSLDMAKFVHYVCNPEEDCYYGRSELRAAYRSWYMKDVLIKMQALWLERMAGGFLTAMVDKDANPLSPQDKAALESALANVKNLSGMLMPPGTTLTVTQASGEGAAFTNAIEYHDLAIAKALLVPNLLGVSNTGGKTGSYSQAQTQLEAFFWTLNADSNRLEAVLDNQLFQDLYVANFGDGQYPCFKFKPASEEFIKWVVGQWATLIGANSVITTEADEAHLRTILNMPARGPDDKPLQTPAQEAAAKIAAAGGDPLKPGTTSITPGGGNKEPQVGANDSTEGYSRHRAHTKDGKPLTCSLSAFSRASQRVAFSVIATRAEDMSADASKKISGLMAKAVGKTLTDLPEMLKNPAQVQDVVFDKASMSKLKAACVDALGRGWDLGSRQANNEIDQARKAGGQNSRRIFTALRGDSASGFLDANGFRMAGNLADGARAIIQQQLLQAIKSGDRPEEAASQIYQRLIDKGFTDLSSVDDQTDDSDVKDALKAAVGATTEAGTLAYLNTLTRTNIFESLNEARYAAFTDPNLDGFVEALEYSAILDDRTTEICQALDGYTASDDSDTWDTYRPPNHYNCRSVLVPITQVDGWDGQDDPDPSVDPQAGFGAGEK
jgi:SPP1 gp7 family putative phage head morphogenesis protein